MTFPELSCSRIFEYGWAIWGTVGWLEDRRRKEVRVFLPPTLPAWITSPGGVAFLCGSSAALDSEGDPRLWDSMVPRSPSVPLAYRIQWLSPITDLWLASVFPLGFSAPPPPMQPTPILNSLCSKYLERFLFFDCILTDTLIKEKRSWENNTYYWQYPLCQALAPHVLIRDFSKALWWRLQTLWEESRLRVPVLAWTNPVSAPVSTSVS